MASTRLPAYSDDKDAVLKRLRRIEGQVRGLQRRLVNRWRLLGGHHRSDEVAPWVIRLMSTQG